MGGRELLVGQGAVGVQLSEALELVVVEAWARPGGHRRCELQATSMPGHDNACERAASPYSEDVDFALAADAVDSTKCESAIVAQLGSRAKPAQLPGRIAAFDSQ